MINNLLAGGPEITNPVLGNLGDLTGVMFFQSFIPSLVGLAFAIGTVVFFFILIIGSIQWITSAGDKQALEAARGKITNAIIGVVIMLSLFAVLNLVQTFFNITIMTLDIGPLVIQ